jgi:hypothetical protein
MAFAQLSIHMSPELFYGGQAAEVVNHSPPSIAEVTNEWSCTSAPLICLHVVEREYLVLENSNSM